MLTSWFNSCRCNVGISMNNPSQNSHFNTKSVVICSNVDVSFINSIFESSSSQLKPNSGWTDFKCLKHIFGLTNIWPHTKHFSIRTDWASTELTISTIFTVVAWIDLAMTLSWLLWCSIRWLSMWRSNPDAWTYTRWHTKHVWTELFAFSLHCCKMSPICFRFSLRIFIASLCKNKWFSQYSVKMNFFLLSYWQQCSSKSLFPKIWSQFVHCVWILNALTWLSPDMVAMWSEIW